MLCKKSAIMSTCPEENKKFWDCVQAITVGFFIILDIVIF